MPVSSKALDAIVGKTRNSSVMALRRKHVLGHAGSLVMRLAMNVVHPLTLVPANDMFMRFVPEKSKYLKNYHDVFSLPPDLEADDDTKGAGGLSTSNRFTGAIGGGRGLNGSYWGKADGIAGEDAYYSMWKNVDGSGSKGLRAKYGHVMVQRAAGALNHWEDRDVPRQLIFSGSASTNIIVARTIRPIRCLNLDLMDPVVEAHLKRQQGAFQQLLTGLEFDSMAAAIEDSEFREFARHYAYGACFTMGVEGIWASSVRHQEGQLLHGYNKDAAHNLVLLGEANGTLSDRLVGCGVIKIRTSDASGLTVTAEPIVGKHTAYDDGQIRALTVIKQ
jgi:hypothetical protein